MQGVVAKPIVFVTPDWLWFLYQVMGEPFRNITRYQVGDECFRDFRLEAIVLRVRMTAKNWEEDKLERVLLWIVDEEKKKLEIIRAENFVPEVVPI